MLTILDWFSGICWALVYILAICLGIRKKTYYIPAVCICLNISWEILVVLARVYQASPLDSGFVSQILWLLLDIGVLATWLRYATNRSFIRKCMMFCGTIIIMMIFTLGLGLWKETAFLINLIMSVSYLFRIDKQIQLSLPIAILKCVGTLAATILNGVLLNDWFILLIGGLCFIADVYFIYEIARRGEAIGIKNIETKKEGKT